MLILVSCSSINDLRFSWLRNVLLQYFKDRVHSIEEQQSNFTQKDCQKMFISRETYEGLNVTVNSIIEGVQVLLQYKGNYVLTEGFCQNHLEHYFGHQGSTGVQKDNHALGDVGYYDSTIFNQKVYQ